MAFSPLSTQKVSAIQRKNFSLNCYACFNLVVVTDSEAIGFAPAAAGQPPQAASEAASRTGRGTGRLSGCLHRRLRDESEEGSIATRSSRIGGATRSPGGKRSSWRESGSERQLHAQVLRSSCARPGPPVASLLASHDSTEDTQQSLGFRATFGDSVMTPRARPRDLRRSGREDHP
jgi:hypothetical protein